MANEKRLIDAEPIKKFIVDGLNNPDLKKAFGHDAIEILTEIEYAPTEDAVAVKCKVGAWVYALWEAPVKQKYIIYCAEVKEIRISMRNCRLTTTYILEPIMYRGHRKEYRDDDFGKLVFLEESEAQEALCGERREGE